MLCIVYTSYNSKREARNETSTVIKSSDSWYRRLKTIETYGSVKVAKIYTFDENIQQYDRFKMSF